MISTREEFVSFLEKTQMTSAKWWILHIRMRQLEKVLESGRLLDVAQMLRTFEKGKLGRLFEIGGDIFIYFPQTREDDMLALIVKIKFLSGPRLKDKFAFYTIYQLQTQMDDLLDLLKPQEEKKEVEASTLQTTPSSTVTTPIFQEPPSFMPFRPILLAQLEKTLLQADLSNIIRNQPVCAIVGKSPPLELFKEVYVAITDLIKTLCPNVDVRRSPHLFNRLMETLDKRVLENVAHHDGGAYRKNFSLNLSVKSLSTEDFLRFDESLTASNKETILLEIKQSDICTNLASFLSVREKIQRKGYRFCMDLVTFDSLALVQREKLGLDMIKIIWSADILNKPLLDLSKKAIQKTNPERLILCHVDDKRAIDFAQNLGISIFQGYYIQKLLYKTPKAVRINRPT